jgi:radical SAM protein with 4Fe4S-binding SPASM domain
MPVFENLRKTAYRLYVKQQTKDHELLYLFLELTRRCNLNCIHCGSDCSSTAPNSELTTESWLKILDYIRQTFDPLPLIVLTGGEPTVYKDLNSITSFLSEHKFPWGMVTNGYNLTEKKLQSFIDQDIRSITLSFDGDQESTEYIRDSKGAYKKILASMSLIGGSDIPFKDAVTCVYPGNLNKLSWISDLLLEQGMNSHRLFRIFPKGRAEKNAALSLNFDQTMEMLRWIEDNREQYMNKGLNLSYSCEGYLPFSTDLKVRSEPFFCRSGINIAAILSDGSITGCNNNGPEYFQGNIRFDNFASVWQNKFQEYRNKEWLKTGLCAECREWKNCLGSSIHLREKSKPGPNFCYVHTMDFVSKKEDGHSVAENWN